MTGFGYDPSHSIVKARQDGLQTVLYKPFRTDRLLEAVEQAMRTPTNTDGDGSVTPQSPTRTAPSSTTTRSDPDGLEVVSE